MHRHIQILTVLTLIVGVAGCPRGKRRTLVPDVPTSGDDTARARFQEARSHFERDGQRDAAEFQAIAEEYPDDPVADYALLYAGMAALDSGDYQAASDQLQALDEEPGLHEGMRARGRLFLGMAETHLGRYQQAVEHLEEGRRGVENEDEKRRFVAYLAEARGRGSEPLSALADYNRWYNHASAAEKAYITARLQAIAEQVDMASVAKAYRRLGRPDTPAGVVLGIRVATDLRAAGDEPGAAHIERAIAGQRATMGLADDSAGAGDTGDTGQVAAVLPVSGARTRVGSPALRGMSLAAGTFLNARDGDMQPFNVAVHDTTSSIDGARAAVEAIASGKPIAIVGPIDGKTVDAVAPLAHSLGVPLISLNVRSGRRAREGSKYVFHVQLSAEDRAEALARLALRKGVKNVAILRPDNGYGRAVGKAFAAQVEELGGRVVKEVSYPPKTTSFGGVVAKLGRGFDALFIPDRARRLALIAPALKAGDLQVHALGALERARERADKRRARRRGRRSGKRAPIARPIALLSTAELVNEQYLRSAGRYSRGAVFAPGFYPDREDAVIRDFVERYEIAFGRLPTPLDAHAYDAARLVRTVVDQGASSRAQVARGLARVDVEGLTGTIAFDETHRRSDSGLLFQVVADGNQFAIRAMR